MCNILESSINIAINQNKDNYKLINNLHNYQIHRNTWIANTSFVIIKLNCNEELLKCVSRT